MILTTEDYKQVYEILNQATPLSEDCGRWCNAICCQPRPAFSYSPLYIYLLPGEDALFDKSDPWLKWYSLNTKKYRFPKSWGKRFYAVRCLGPSKCKRSLRPIQCRTFPLMPYLTADGKFQLVLYNQPLPYECPLITDGVSLNENFIKAVRDAWEILIKDVRIYDYINADSANIRKFGLPMQVVD